MALTDFQRRVCRIIAQSRIAQGESYVAGAVALNEATGFRRVSADVDIFHDARDAVNKSFDQDRNLLESQSYEVVAVRQWLGFVEAQVVKGDDAVILQWAADSAFRFFPLITHPDFGLTLHPFDLATNKVLALVGRAEVRDWVDIIGCHAKIQPLGLLAWAASGKDPGFCPRAIVEHAARSSRYTQVEVDSLEFEPHEEMNAAKLSQEWHQMIADARAIIEILPADEVGKCVTDLRGEVFSGSVAEIEGSLVEKKLGFHAGSIRGAWPVINEAS